MVKADLFLFVSHVREDQAAAMEIVAELERRGVLCWVAPRDVYPGKPFDDEIAEALENCRAMLLVFSDRCNDNHYIRREVTVAGAIADFTEAIRLDPKNAYSFFWRGLAYFDKQDYDRAIADFTEAIRLDPKNAETFVRRGRAKRHKGDHAGAEADMPAARAIDPNVGE